MVAFRVAILAALAAIWPITLIVFGLSAGIVTLVTHWKDLGDAIKLVWVDFNKFTSGKAGKVLEFFFGRGDGVGNDNPGMGAAAAPTSAPGMLSKTISNSTASTVVNVDASGMTENQTMSLIKQLRASETRGKGK